MRFLKTYLADGPKPGKEVTEAAVGQGITGATLKRARETVVMCSKEKGTAHGRSIWQLLPDGGGVF